MYLHSHSSGSSRNAREDLPSMLSKTVGREMLNAAICRTSMKDTTSSKLNVKGPKQADAVHRAELSVLRSELKALPEGLRENARMNYLLDQNIKRKDLQDFQCAMIGKVEAILRKNIIESGLNYRKYKVGGYDKGTYERFFRVEPARYMSKAQLTTALRRSFGDSVIKSDSAIGKLFDSFDFNRTDEMDWRAFLYMLSMLMQPYLFCDSLLRWGYAIYSSVGSLDLDCTEPLALGMMKDMLCVPIVLSLRSYIKHAFDSAWLQLSTTDTDTILYAAKKTSTAAARAADPDDLKITFKILNKILTMTPFARFLVTATVFGTRDQRTWTCVLEEQYYHPRVLRELKALRREERSNNEADAFIAARLTRTKNFSVQIWKEYTRKRNFIRFVLIGGEVRSQIRAFTLYFDHWRRVTLELQCRLLLQRVTRGYLARCRGRFIGRIRHKATLIQSNTRKMFAIHRYKQTMIRLNWAATTIQRLYRGIFARKKITTRIQAYYDTEQRKLQKSKNVWYYWRVVYAFLGIKLYCTRYLRRVNQTKLDEQNERIEIMQNLMAEEAKKAFLNLEIYKSNLSNWYLERKSMHDLDTLNEQQTLNDRKVILDRRNQKIKEIKAAKLLEREERFQKIEEEKTEIWLKNWETKIALLGQQRRKRCEVVLVQPENPEDLLLKNDLQKRIKAQIKDVLRRADKMKIPMEIPEALENATKEIIDFECEAEMQRARDEMKAEATKIQKQTTEKERKAKEDEEKARGRRKKWAVLTMQGYMRVFLSRRLTRQRAYKRYVKYFDKSTHNYYYEDQKTHLVSWDKPKSLGSYDVPMENYWIFMSATAADGTPITHKVTESVDPDNPENTEQVEKEIPLVYYYNPSSWKQSWTRPSGTVLCAQCQDDFAHRFLNYDQQSYCDACFYQAAERLVQSGMHPKYITYKTFQGGSEKAYKVDFFSLKDENYFMLIMDANPELKQSEEEEVAAAKRARNRALMSPSSKSLSTKSARSGKYGQQRGLASLVELCSVCDDRIAVLTCQECEQLFCQSCCDVTHSIACYAFHNISTYIPEIQQQQPDEADELDRQIGDTKKKSKKSKRKRKHGKAKKEKSQQDNPDCSNSETESAYTTAAGTPAALSEAADTDMSVLSSPDKYRSDTDFSDTNSKISKQSKRKHKKDRKSTDPAEAKASTAKSSDKKKAKKHRTSESESELDSVPNKTHKHKEKHHKIPPGSDLDTVNSQSTPHKHKQKKKSKQKKQETEPLSPSDDGATVRKKEKKAKKNKKEVPLDDSSAAAGLEAGYDTATSTNTKNKKEKKKLKKEKQLPSRDLGVSELADTVSGMQLTDPLSPLSSPEKQSKAHKKKHKKDKKDQVAAMGYTGSSAEGDRDRKQKKHKKQKSDHRDEPTSHPASTPTVSSSFKLPDIFKRSTASQKEVTSTGVFEQAAAAHKRSKHRKHKKPKKHHRHSDVSDLSSPDNTEDEGPQHRYQQRSTSVPDLRSADATAGV